MSLITIRIFIAPLNIAFLWVFYGCFHTTECKTFQHRASCYGPVPWEMGRQHDITRQILHNYPIIIFITYQIYVFELWNCLVLMFANHYSWQGKLSDQEYKIWNIFLVSKYVLKREFDCQSEGDLTRRPRCMYNGLC